MLLISKKKRAWAAVMYQAAITGIKERRPSVIMAWGHGPRLKRINRHQRRHIRTTTEASHSLRSACCDGSWQNRQQGEREAKNKKRTRPLKQREKGSPRRSRASTICLGRRSCCHISAPHGSCPCLATAISINATPSRQQVLLPHLCPTWILSPVWPQLSVS